jgi:hypothetical protein
MHSAEPQGLRMSIVAFHTPDELASLRAGITANTPRPRTMVEIFPLFHLAAPVQAIQISRPLKLLLQSTIDHCPAPLRGRKSS